VGDVVQESTPRRRVTAAVAREGEQVFVRRCLDLLAGDSVDAALVDVLGGNSAPHVLAGREGGPTGHWPRTWALRALLYAWGPPAEPAVVAAGADEHWRVREMAAKVLAYRRPTSAESERALEELALDPHPRVRAAAERALR
jgi:hypothetical protein